MRLRFTVPAAAASALLAAALALPAGAAVADNTPAPTDAPTATAGVTATPSDTPSPTDTPTATDTPSPTDSPTDAPTDAPTGTPTDSPSPTDSPVTHQDWVNSVQNSWSDYWSLSLNAGASEGLQTITAHYRLVGAPADAPDAGVSSGFVEDPYYGWTAPAPTLPALGTYEVSVDVTDTSGVTQSFPDAGTFVYAAKVGIGALSADRSTVDYDHRTVVLSAGVKVTDPSTGSALDPSGVVVGITDAGVAIPGTTVATGTVAATGRLSASIVSTGTQTYSVNGAGPDTARYGTTPGPDGYPYHLATATQSQVTVTAQAEQARIRILSSTNVKLPVGGHTTITGVLERKDGSKWVGAPKEGISWSQYPYGNGQITTASDGTFKLAVSQAGSYSFATYWDYDPFLQGTDDYSSGVVVHIPQPNKFTGFSVTENEYGEAVIHGSVYDGYEVLPKNKEFVEIQFSTNDKTWHNVGAAKISTVGATTNGFGGYATYGSKANGYWRAYYPGDTDWRSVYSKAIHISRTVTRVTGGKPNHTTVRKNTTIYFSGHVQQESSSGKWTKAKGGYAYLLFRPYKSKTWYSMARVKLTSAGVYHLHAKAPAGGTWTVVWLTPDKSHIDAQGPQTYVHA